MSLNIRPFAKVLRSAGFVKDFDSVEGGGRVVQFVNTIGERRVEVQLWYDGRHRASHMLNGRGSTYPTPFKTPEEMMNAIRRELTRDDHKPRTKP